MIPDVINVDFLFLFYTCFDLIIFLGRAGRAGRNGEAVTLFTEADVPCLRQFVFEAFLCVYFVILESIWGIRAS